MSWTKEWKKVVFSDAKRFNLDGPDGYRYYWHDLRKNELVLSKRQMGGGSIMFWGAVGWKGKSNIILCPNKLDQKSYKDILRDQIIGKGKDLAGHGWIFQHDNASVHKANSITKYFYTNKRQVLDWPSLSPDLNIIENI